MTAFRSAWKQVVEWGGLCRQGRGQRVRGRRDAAVAEDETEGLDRRRRPMDSTDQRRAVSDRLLLDFDAFLTAMRPPSARGARIKREVEPS